MDDDGVGELRARTGNAVGCAAGGFGDVGEVGCALDGDTGGIVGGGSIGIIGEGVGGGFGAADGGLVGYHGAVGGSSADPCADREQDFGLGINACESRGGGGIPSEGVSAECSAVSGSDVVEVWIDGVGDDDVGDRGVAGVADAEGVFDLVVGFGRSTVDIADFFGRCGDIGEGDKDGSGVVGCGSGGIVGEQLKGSVIVGGAGLVGDACSVRNTRTDAGFKGDLGLFARFELGECGDLGCGPSNGVSRDLAVVEGANDLKIGVDDVCKCDLIDDAGTCVVDRDGVSDDIARAIRTTVEISGCFGEGEARGGSDGEDGGIVGSGRIGIVGWERGGDLISGDLGLVGDAGVVGESRFDACGEGDLLAGVGGDRGDRPKDAARVGVKDAAICGGDGLKSVGIDGIVDHDVGGGLCSRVSDGEGVSERVARGRIAAVVVGDGFGRGQEGLSTDDDGGGIIEGRGGGIIGRGGRIESLGGQSALVEDACSSGDALGDLCGEGKCHAGVGGDIAKGGSGVAVPVDRATAERSALSGGDVDQVVGVDGIAYHDVDG